MLVGARPPRPALSLGRSASARRAGCAAPGRGRGTRCRGARSRSSRRRCTRRGCACPQPARTPGRSRSRWCPVVARTSRPSTRPSTPSTRPSGIAMTAAQTKAAPRCSSGTSPTCSRSRSRLARSRSARAASGPAVDPDHRAEKTPGSRRGRRPRAGVVGHGRQTGGLGERDGLEPRVAEERHLGLGDVGAPSTSSAPTTSRSSSSTRSARICRSPWTLCSLRVARTSRRSRAAPGGWRRGRPLQLGELARSLVSRGRASRRARPGRAARPRPCPAPRRTGRRRS